jgi:benzoyl-CoA oxygenase/reductase BoxA protein
MSGSLEVLKQHLIDPEVCIRCNTCEETCPVGAITHDSANYVVNADICNACMACISPCPTGSIDNWREVAKTATYSVKEQYTWTELPKQGEVPAGSPVAANPMSAPPTTREPATDAPPLMETGNPSAVGIEVDIARGSRIPPWSAAHPYVNVYTHKTPIKATVAGNYRLTAEASESDVHHVVLDFGQVPFPVLEGQSIAVLPSGTMPDGRPHFARQYSIASPRNGERPGYNNLSLTVKRVRAEPGAVEQDGVCSNYLCDVKKGDVVHVIGPYGSTFLMPNHPGSNLLMICTGTGSAPMRGMTEYRRRRLSKDGSGGTGKLMLFFGARTKEELPYFGPLMNLPKDFIDVTFAFSRTPGQPKHYVQDALRDRAPDVAAMLKDDETYIYVCGLKGMEDGVLLALADVANGSGQPWEPLWKRLRDMGRLHFETY